MNWLDETRTPDTCWRCTRCSLQGIHYTVYTVHVHVNLDTPVHVHAYLDTPVHVHVLPNSARMGLLINYGVNTDRLWRDY